MITKKNLIKRFQQNPNRYWKVSLFDELGFKRKQCEKCKSFFWSLDNERKICSDPDCIGYQFIGQKNTKKRWDLIGSWKEFEKFFKKNSHSSIKRYPVVSRWHPNLFFTIASIQNFQRFDNNKLMFEYPANPLIVPQISLRFNDIPNVGVTGRHMTSFQMSGQHAFNDGSKKGYWKDRCIELNFEFLTKVIGIPDEEIIYKEDIWAMPDFSAFGPCIESFAKGLEIANNVFMEFGLIDSKIKELPLKVVDVGWGAERIPWYTQGTPTIYDVAFGDVVNRFQQICNLDYDKELFLKYSKLAGYLDIDKGTNISIIKKNIASKLNVSVEHLEKKIEPITAMYAILDHSRTLMFALNDGALPSNTGGSYNLRVLFRRMESFIDKYKWHVDLHEIIEMHAKYLRPLFPELRENLDEVNKIIDIEKIKYQNTKEKSRQMVNNLIMKNINENLLLEVYDTHGISPEIIREEAEKLGKRIKVPDDFYARVSELHEKKEQKHQTKKEFFLDFGDLPETEVLYLKDYKKIECKSKVLKIIDNFVVLDKTVAYPTSGGQLYDLGRINDIEFIDVFKQGNIVVHKLKDKPNFKVKDEVAVKINLERRLQITMHHDAAHILNGASKKILGSHVNQASAFKDTDKGHLDITHYQGLSDEDIKRIEDLSNSIIDKKISILSNIMPRNEAEKKYGMNIYQGGAVPGKYLRIVEIKDFDVEACSGTHSQNSETVKLIKITKSSKISDSIVRLEYVAGAKALQFLDKEKNLTEELCELLKVDKRYLICRAEELFDKWKKAVKKDSKEKENFVLTSKIENKLNDEEILIKCSEILRTQREFLPNTIRRFLKELEAKK